MRNLMRSFVVGMAAATLVACWTGVQHAAAQLDPPVGEPTSTSGKVVETMNASTYTYVQVDDGSKRIWAAAPQFAVAVGDKVVVPEGMPMRDFHSETLGRTFELIYFVSAIQVTGGPPPVTGGPPPVTGGSPPVTGGPPPVTGGSPPVTGGRPPSAPLAAAAHGASSDGASAHGASPHSAAPAAAVDLSNIRKAEGGRTVAELFREKAALTGKEVVVRGRAVKVTLAVMGKNWIHVRDGSGSAGTNDLAVSTSADVGVGDMVLVRGKLGTDRDLGAGYHYDVIIEDATVAVE